MVVAAQRDASLNDSSPPAACEAPRGGEGKYCDLDGYCTSVIESAAAAGQGGEGEDLVLSSGVVVKTVVVVR